MEELIPSKFYLSQNSPNPFNSSTTIKYCLPVKTRICLKIYNSNGEMIKELVNKKQEAGTYEIKFNGNGFSCGDYYYTIIAHGLSKRAGDLFNETKRMVLKK